ncbi:MAG: glycosyltransferase family 2 protein [Planctomycetaceae bacterium]
MRERATTVICPAYNEAENLELLVQRIGEVLGTTDPDHEILVVDDGSTDGSLALLERLVKTTPNLTVVALAGNHGQTKALQAGFDHASGRRIVTIDSDLQMDPGDIPRMIEKLERDGLDIVYVRKRYENAPWIRRFASAAANRFRRAVTKDTAIDVGCNYKVYRRNFLRGRNFGSGLHRFFTGFAEAEGLSLGWVEGKIAPRTVGFSKYTVFGRLRQGLADMFYYALHRSPRTRIPRLLWMLWLAAVLVCVLPVGSGLREALLLALAGVHTAVLALLAHALHLTVMRTRVPYRVARVLRGGAASAP